MQKILLFIFFLFTVTEIKAQEITVIKLSGLTDILNRKNDTTYVINFWATWCKPCVKELPSFDTLHTHNQHNKLKIYLISLDNIKELEGKVIPFVRSRNPKPEVLLLDETDYNKWIDLVSSDWGGAIPATLIFSPATGNRRIIEGETTFSELQQLIRDISEKN